MKVATILYVVANTGNCQNCTAAIIDCYTLQHYVYFMLLICSIENPVFIILHQTCQYICNSYNMGKRDLPDISPSPWACGPQAQGYIGKS